MAPTPHASITRFSWGGGEDRNHRVRLSVCPFFSSGHLSNRLIILNQTSFLVSITLCMHKVLSTAQVHLRNPHTHKHVVISLLYGRFTCLFVSWHSRTDQCLLLHRIILQKVRITTPSYSALAVGLLVLWTMSFKLT